MGEKTALVLSGGGSRGAYEIGVWKALNELGIKIDGVYGTSVGSINAAMVVQGDVDYTISLWLELKTNNVFDVKSDKKIDYVYEAALHKGAGTNNLSNLLNKYINEDEIRKANMDFGLTCVSLPKKELKYLRLKDIPKGQLVDYIIASSSFAPAIHSKEIDGVSYIDGGFGDTMPVKMALEDGYEKVILVDLDVFGKYYSEEIKKVPELIYIKSKHKLGFQLSFEEEHTKWLIELGYLDALKAFKIIDGEYMAFKKDEFSKEEVSLLDQMLFDFNADSTIIYDKVKVIDLLFEKKEKASLQLDLLLEKINNEPIKAIKILSDVLKNKEGKLLIALYIGLQIKNDKKEKFNLFKTYEKYAEYLINNGVI